MAGGFVLLVYPAIPLQVSGQARRMRAGGQAVLGGQAAAVWRLVQACRQGQYAGRCRVGRPCGRASRAGTRTRCLRSVAPRAFAWNRPARDPAARIRLWLMPAHTSQAAFAANRTDVILSCPLDHGFDLLGCDADGVLDAT